MATTRQAQVPGGAYVNEVTDQKQEQIPGYHYVNEDTQAGAGSLSVNQNDSVTISENVALATNPLGIIALSVNDSITIAENIVKLLTPSYPVFLHVGHTTPNTVSHETVANVVITSTTAGSTLVVCIESGDDPDAPAAVSSVAVAVISGGSADFVYRGSITNIHSHAEIWTATNVSAGITSITVTMASATVFSVQIAEYGNVVSLGQVVTNSGGSYDPTISLTTVDSYNMMVAALGNEGTAQSAFSTRGLSAGNGRAYDSALGDGFPDVSGVLADNSRADPGSLSCTVDYQFYELNWAAVAIELRSSPGVAALGIRVFN